LRFHETNALSCTFKVLAANECAPVHESGKRNWMAAKEHIERIGKRAGCDLPKAKTFTHCVKAKGAGAERQTGFFALFAFSSGYFNCGI
jgi:hypothetical protein